MIPQDILVSNGFDYPDISPIYVTQKRVGVRLPTMALLSLVSRTDSLCLSCLVGHLLLILPNLSRQLPPKLDNHIHSGLVRVPKGINMWKHLLQELRYRMEIFQMSLLHSTPSTSARGQS